MNKTLKEIFEEKIIEIEKRNCSACNSTSQKIHLCCTAFDILYLYANQAIEELLLTSTITIPEAQIIENWLFLGKPKEIYNDGLDGSSSN